MENNSKLTEDQTIEILIKFLSIKGWHIDNYCLVQSRGCDIIASKGSKRLYVEVKGAKASDNSPTKRRKHFDSGQIKTHFGKALVQTLEEISDNKGGLYAIAHPDDEDIRRAIGKHISILKNIGIIHFWVNPKGHVEIQNMTEEI